MNKINDRKGLPRVKPLYTMNDVVNTLSQFLTVGYRRKTMVTDGVTVTFYDAGISSAPRFACSTFATASAK